MNWRYQVPGGRSPAGVPGGRSPAELIAFLASPGAAYLTGSQFTVDGGVLPTLWGDS